MDSGNTAWLLASSALVCLMIPGIAFFYGGMVGVIYTQFSVTMCVALCISTINALTLSPALCAIILRPAGAEPNKLAGFIFWPFNWLLETSRRIYMWGAGILVRNVWLTVLLLLLVSPSQCLGFLLFLLALQLANGGFLRPRLLGSSLRLSGFWAMPVLVLGAGLFGFWGLLLGLPAFLVLRRLLDGCIGKKLKKSDLPEEVTAYMDLDAIDPITHEPVKRGSQE